jgi:hypothetical protein
MNQKTQITIVCRAEQNSSPSFFAGALEAFGYMMLALFITIAIVSIIAPFVRSAPPPWNADIGLAATRSEVVNGGVAQLRIIKVTGQSAQYVACISEPSGWCAVTDRYYLLAMYKSGFSMIADIPAAVAAPSADDYGPPAVFEAGGPQDSAMNTYEQEVRAWFATHGPGA